MVITILRMVLNGLMENLVRYVLYLNGKPYGTGDLRYMHELITDYISRMESFGTEEVEFKIERRG